MPQVSAITFIACRGQHQHVYIWKSKLLLLFFSCRWSRLAGVGLIKWLPVVENLQPAKREWVSLWVRCGPGTWRASHLKNVKFGFDGTRWHSAEMFHLLFCEFPVWNRQECMKLSKYGLSNSYKVKCLKPSHTLKIQDEHTHIHREIPPPHSTLHTNKHSQPFVTLCQPRPVLFPGFTGLQCPHCERAAATARCWITVKYYPDDIDIVGYASLFLFQAWPPPSQVGEQSFLLTAAGCPQTSGHHRTHVP